MARKSLIACNSCGAITEARMMHSILVPPSGWFLVKVEWPGQPYNNSGEEWLVCSPGCFTTLADVTAERQAELEASS